MQVSFYRRHPHHRHRELLFGSMNLFAFSGGLPVWANLMLAATDEVQSALQGELATREQRIAKYVEKYQK